MHEAAASGEWISVWLSPVAQFLFDVVFAAFVLAAIGLVIRLVRWARHRDSRTSS
jgi:hypothetical protein